MTQDTVVKKNRAPLGGGRMLNAEYERIVWRATAESGTTLEEVLVPGYWSTVSAGNLKPFHIIEVMPDDMTWFAQLLVLSCDRTWAKVTVLMHKELTSAEKAPVTEEYKIEFAGPHLKHRIIRLNDKAVIKDKIPLLEDAQRQLAEYLKAIDR